MTARITIVAILALLFCRGAAHAQLRIVTYNTNTFGTEGLVPGLPSNHRPVRPEADIVFEAIGEELVNGIQRPADIILLQEQQQPDTTTQNLVDRLNSIYAGTGVSYARGIEVGRTTFTTGFGAPNSSEIRQSVVYRTDSVQLIDEDSFGNISSNNQPRETLLHQFRPIGYGPDADLYIFNSHFEASDTTGFGGDRFARENEATDIRNYITANSLGSSNVIMAGDLNVRANFRTSGVSNFGGLSALQILAAGSDADGRLLDPLFPNGENVDFQIFNSGVPNTQFGVSLSQYLTQSPSDGAGPLVGGGIDDRFDFLLQSDELLDGEGVASIPGSLRSFGNNGSTGNDQINDGNTIQLQGLTSFTTSQVLNALEAASDHLPVVEDFQLPAVLTASVLSVTNQPEQDAPATLMLSIENTAPVDVAIGADELEYTIAVSGDTVFSGSGSDMADGFADVLSIPLDTSVVGLRSATAVVSTTSPGVPVSFFSFDIDYEVLAPTLLGDFNEDGFVDAADYTVWRDGLGTDFTVDQYLDWRQNFGQGTPPTVLAGPALRTPEPNAALLLAAACLAAAAGRAEPSLGGSSLRTRR